MSAVLAASAPTGMSCEVHAKRVLQDSRRESMIQRMTFQKASVEEIGMEAGCDLVAEVH